jgi:tetratricopeptide (TPR) repeat protein
MRARLALAALATIALATAPALAGAAGLKLNVGEASDLTKIEFRGAAMHVQRTGDTLVLTFSGAGKPDLTRLTVDPPKWLKSAKADEAGGRLQLTLVLADGADAKTGAADGADFVDLFQKAPAPPPPPASSAPAASPMAGRPDPVPASGVVVAQATRSGPQVAVTFPWKAPLGAAVFRRGDAIWVVFDTKARLDLAAVQRAAPEYRSQVVEGPDDVAVRFDVPEDTPYSAAGQGAFWTLILGPGAQARSLQVPIARSVEDGPAQLTANVAGSTRIVWLDDPAVGDRIAVATALSPAKGVMLRRAYVDLATLPSAQGLAVVPEVDDLQVSTDGDVVRISRPNGLNLSPSTRTRLADELDMPMPAIMPGLVNFDQWSRTGAGGFSARYDGLMGAVAAEANRQALGDKSTGITAHMGFARFLVGSQLSYEAIGVLNLIAKDHPELMANPEFRGLRGAAKVMARRYAEAQTDFASPTLADDPASALWRGYSDDQLGQYSEARQEFQNGGKALPLFTAAWRAKFARAEADAALRLNDFVTANTQIQYAMKQAQEPLEQLATFLIYARLLEAEGQPQRALPIYDAVARAPSDRLSAPALLHATQIRLYAGQVSPDNAALVFDSLRFRWRGDATELEDIRALGQLYLSEGRYRDALEILRTARQVRQDLPEASDIQNDLSNAFRGLFLNGQADGLEPIQALGLFYDFKELTPIGADGDEMVRKLAQRLVNVDLLDQAAELLNYQATSRLDGVPRAEVATDLAIIQLMARHPEGAIDALNMSRTTLLPTALQTQRRLIEARAWLELGQLDHADEILGTDSSAEGVTLRAELAWKRRNWPLAGKIFEDSLGDRYKTQDGKLTPEDESKLLRAATAYSLAQDDASLGRLRDHYQSFVDRAHWPDALRVALSGVNVDQITGATFAQAIADDQTFASWADRMKARFKADPLGGPVAPPMLRPLTTADAGEATPAAGPGAPGKAAPPKTAKS